MFKYRNMDAEDEAGEKKLRSTSGSRRIYPDKTKMLDQTHTCIRHTGRCYLGPFDFIFSWVRYQIVAPASVTKLQRMDYYYFWNLMDPGWKICDFL